MRIQVYSAIIAYTTVAIMKHRCSLKHSTYEILQILSLTLLNKTPVNELFDQSHPTTLTEESDKQLKIFEIGLGC